jgi:hypothetical protein
MKNAKKYLCLGLKKDGPLLTPKTKKKMKEKKTTR